MSSNGGWEKVYGDDLSPFKLRGSSEWWTIKVVLVPGNHPLLRQGEGDDALTSGAWCIVGETSPRDGDDGEPDEESIQRKILWISPCSYNFPLPPEDDWLAVDKLARGKPRVECVAATGLCVDG